MDPVQQLYEQLNCNSAEQLDFNNCYIDNCDISSIKLVGSDTYGALSKRWLEESRCVPRNRLDLKRRLDELGLKVYDPLRIVEKTHGIMYPMDNIRIDITDIVEEWKIDNKEINK